MSCYLYIFACFAIGIVSGDTSQTRCDDDGVLPNSLQTALTACQSDLESLITRGFFQGLADVIKAQKEANFRSRREAYPGRHEIAGCMLLCMFRKLKMVDEEEIPTVEGLIKHLGDGVKQRGYFLAMTQAAQQCVTVGKALKNTTGSPTHKCVISYKIFDCVRGQIMDYCQGN